MSFAPQNTAPIGATKRATYLIFLHRNDIDRIVWGCPHGEIIAVEVEGFALGFGMLPCGTIKVPELGLNRIIHILRLSV